ncbi:hypothetical protein [Nocardioides panaciterrulae]|uniref:Big-1 domain-containing protein n=1 Tax=Nocardioides panaciterrulae TaxID=661492 RepID=A0A7Y9E470_9ACTN|nr:hypothetical protein [Nocardioides panaciterrulae]NYD40785.1 hypothetical protein [Nocardioides panaciterrulae]
MLAMLAGLLVLLAPPALAGPVDAGWTASGPGTVTTVSDGSRAAASMTYDLETAGQSPRSWEFTTTATPASADGPVTVPWTWQGLHAWFQVTAGLQMVVNGQMVGTLVSAGPTSCCSSPSNGFLYGGAATFHVSAGDTYGFRLSGSNGDLNNFLRGTFTLSTKPYVDATIGTDNRQWLGAADLPEGGVDGTLAEPGEARWFRFPVVPGQHVSVDLGHLPADYDVALYGDIGAAFQSLTGGDDVTRLAATSAAGAPGPGSQVPSYPDAVTTVPTNASELPSTTFAPRIYAPRIYAPRIYAPRIYAPRIYAPRIYAPRIYAPDSFVPSLDSDAAFRDAFSAAQDQALLAVSANTGTGEETVSAGTGNTDGYFYVRVQGHTDRVADPDHAFHLGRTVSGGEDCAGLQDHATTPTLAPTRDDARTVIVTDTTRLGLTDGTDTAAFLDSLGSLAGATDGVVVDVADSARVQALQTQAAAHVDCPYAVDLVASAIKDVVDSYRNAGSRYVVIAGGDDVIPFFRYPDVSGLGEESLFEPPLQDNSTAGQSLVQDQVLSQDAYGTDTEVTIGGVTLPVPDLAVGRLVKTPDEIESTVQHYLGLSGGKLPAPTASLVTGYDFLADAAHRVGDEFRAALPGGTNDQLIAESGAPRSTSWTGTDLEHALLDQHHDLVYLAGHFSANDTLAADFETTFDASLLDPTADGGVRAEKLADTVVLSAGCHSGYNIVDGAAVPDRTNTYDWTERMAQQHTVLVGGTGYQYGDSDFLEYSERVYLDLARRLHEGPAAGTAAPVAVGSALALAKQDYLASLGTVTGIDQKAMLEATLYGLPMTGFDAPGRSPLGTDASHVSPDPVTGGPGRTLGLGVDDLQVSTRTDPGAKPSGAGPGLPGQLTWRNGADGVSVQPGAPALPKQVEDVTVAGQVLRGVGFRGGDYTDTTGVLPLTGAPAIEGSTPNTTFESDAFFPQRLAAPNYFGALGASGRTSLILSPAQYRSDPGGALTDTERDYSGLDLRLFYSDAATTSYGRNRPSLAAAPAIGGVHGTVDGGVVTFSATVTGDPSAGVQEVWVTWTGSGDDSDHGQWRSVDLVQDPADSTHWSGTLPLPSGQSWQGIRFLVQAANGVGAVGLDTADGDGYRVTAARADDATVALRTGDPGVGSPLGVTGVVTDAAGQGVADRTVRFTVSRAGTGLFEYAAATAADGSVELALPPDQQPPSGRLQVRADLVDDAGAVTSSASTEVVLAGVGIDTGPAYLTTPAGTAYPAEHPLTATLTDARGPVAGVPVTFTLPAPGPGTPGATFPGGATRASVLTDEEGVATAPAATAGPAVGTFPATVSADGATDAVVAMAGQYDVAPFDDPIAGDGPTTRKLDATLPVRTTLRLADGSRLSDAAAAALVRAGRVQVRWREVGGTGAWRADTDVTRYDERAHELHANLKGRSLGLERGHRYDVELRVLPGPTDLVPPGADPVGGGFDLGSGGFVLRVE